MENVGQIILSQLKALGRNDMMCWGSHNFIALKENQLVDQSLGGLMFGVQGAKFKGRVIISLSGNDTYKIQIGTYYKQAFKSKEMVEGVYFDEMVRIIDDMVEGYYESRQSA